MSSYEPLGTVDLPYFFTMKILLFAIAILFAASSCSTTSQAKKTDDYMNNFMGKRKQDIIMVLGPPNKTDSDGNYGEVLTWAEYRSVLIGGRQNPVWTYTILYFNSSNVVYHWKYKRSPYAPNSVDVRIL